jgi:cephalosporin-C deacetylase-like acetyl esterase
VRLVLDVIDTPSKGPAELATLLERADANRIGLLGMSLGGAVALHVNLDKTPELRRETFTA